MPLTNSNTRYGGVTKTFHWLTALLIITLIPLGIIANQLPYDTSEQLATKAWAFSLHKTLGVTVFFVALARIAWALGQSKPAGLHPERKLESLAAETVHWLLYSSLVIVPLSGWIYHAASSGFAPIWWPFGQSLPLVPKSKELADLFSGVHFVVTKVLALSLFLHVAGALKHHFVDKDVTLRRMWFGTTEGGAETTGHATALPVIAAFAAWALALGAGSALGVYSHSGTAPQAAELAEISSDWEVQDGSIEIAVTQFGSEVVGRFADWTAAITFDETVLNGKSGSVEATISIGSLTLGSVTDQAMGPDFFDTETFPTAQFIADIFTTTDRTTARGTLTIKDQTVPVELPFSLEIKDGVAAMSGSLVLDRLDFGVGQNMADEGTLKFAVDVKIDLSAKRP